MQTSALVRRGIGCSPWQKVLRVVVAKCGVRCHVKLERLQAVGRRMRCSMPFSCS